MQENDFYSALSSYLATKNARVELAPGLEVTIRQMTLRERLTWRSRVIGEDDNLKPSWELELLALTVYKPDGSRVWASADDIDGSEEAIRPILTKCLEVNGLAQGQTRDDEGN